MQKVFTQSGLAGCESMAFPWDACKSSGVVVHLFCPMEVMQTNTTAVLMTVVPAAVSETAAAAGRAALAGLGEMPQMQLH